jgi:hypothetical protein
MLDDAQCPQKAVATIDELVKKKLLTEQEFQKMHHLRDSIAGFKSYCRTIKRFQKDGSNHRLHENLLKRLKPSDR